MSLAIHSKFGPGAARVVPFLLYIAVMMAEPLLRPVFGVAVSYAIQLSATAIALLLLWPLYGELRDVSIRLPQWFAGITTGIVVFVLWINLDAPWMQFGEGRGVASDLSSEEENWSYIALRFAGVAVLVPIMEELFWRSFLIRWLDNVDFLSVTPQSVSWRSIVIASLLFGAEHHLWFAGIVAGLIYGALYRWTGRLWVVIAAHAVTNAVLEWWVGSTGNWQLL